MVEQDFQSYLAQYRAEHADDVLVIDEPVSSDQDITAVVAALAREGRHPLTYFERVEGLSTPVATNVFASRERIARLFGVAPEGLHEAYQARARATCFRRASCPAGRSATWSRKTASTCTRCRC